MRLISPTERAAEVRRLAPLAIPEHPYEPENLYQGIENDASRVPFTLECGHETDYQVQESYRLWKPETGYFYCENRKCGRWVRAATPYEPESTPQQPLF